VTSEAWDSERFVPIVVADTGPINYLVLIGHIDVLALLFKKVVLPDVVRDELMDSHAPHEVRNWIAAPPAWLEIRPAPFVNDVSSAGLDDGEMAAIALAIEIHADLLLMDDRRGVRTARSKGFKVAGTLAILVMAARRGLLDLASALDSLKQTSFHYRQELLDQLLDDTT
jgi:predicted nucleic acid-binding protein